MATLLLQATGAFLGGFLGPVGATIGTAAGALAGYVADRALLQSTRHIHGPRLSGPRPLMAEEGTPVPRLYGTARLGATLIWATRFEESRQTRRQGFKGGPKTTTYSYFANAAFALCEGEISGVRRIWADGKEIDREQYEIRVHTGSQEQQPDPLIEARQGAGNAPAYRGTAYVVFERFPLGDYGNRIPQFQFEVIRSVGTFNEKIRAVVLIPGATEFGLSPTPVGRSSVILGDIGGVGGFVVPGSAVLQNRNVLFGPSDLAASLDELRMLCPNVENVAIVTTWFGNDLRAGDCIIRPMITDAAAEPASAEWVVSGETPAIAAEVSKHNGGPAYGGTPSDQSVIEAIGELKTRGYKVTLYPFVMMDIPAGNALPDPFGGAAQAAYPWRGRITCDPAPGQGGTADKTALSITQIGTFCGSAEPSDFQQHANTVAYNGPAGDWGYRRLILHYANLATIAGGVDGFLIGSELRGLTRVRDDNNEFPFVEQLNEIAGEVASILGPATDITYGADWSEYFGYQPADGSGDVFFHLDALWANPAIAAVGIDNYLPLTDWRPDDYGAEHPDGATGPYDINAIRTAIAAGEHYDWYYVDDTDRRQRIRTPITDGAYAKPWVFRVKDLKSWWQKQHFNRIGGIESSQPTAWVPESKPFWFTELGCAAVDKGPNQPNVFHDPKSDESARPYFSDGGRSDLAQRRFIDAHFRYWDDAEPDFSEADNPVSPLYGGRMVDKKRIFLWAWDARPFPAFPLKTGVWSDGENWLAGHWLNGRLSSVDLGDLINAILADHGLPTAEVTGADGVLTGYVSDAPDSARAALEPLIDLFGLASRDNNGELHVFSENTPPLPAVVPGEFVVPDGEAVVGATRLPDNQLPGEVVLQFRDPMQAFQAVAARHKRREPGQGLSQHSIAFPGLLEAGQGEALAGEWMRRKWVERDTTRFRLPPSARTVSVGSVVRLPFCDGQDDFIVTGIDDGLSRHVEARRLKRLAPLPNRATLPGAVSGEPVPLPSNPLALFLDLPVTGSASDPHFQLRVAAWSRPWRPQVVSASPEETGFDDRTTILQPAVIGILEAPLPQAPAGRIDVANSVELRLIDGELASVSRLQLLNGANALAVQAGNGGWEILQFESAVEIAPSSWRLTGLLRGQLGTEDAVASGVAAGAYAVLLDEAVVPAGLYASEVGLTLNWRVAPSGLLVNNELTSSWTGAGGVRALTPLAPVHLRGIKNASGDFDFSWIRRGRTDADSWLGSDIPLAELAESYRVRIVRTNGAVVRDVLVSSPGWTYPQADISADFPLVSEFDLAVNQVSAAVGDGITATARFPTA